MDMTMLDITGIDIVKEGDEVIVFGEVPAIVHTCRMGGNNTIRIDDRYFSAG